MKKRILFVIDNLTGGGAEKVLYDILRNIDLSKYNIELFLIENKGVYKEKIKRLGININYLFNERKDLFKNTLYKKVKSMIIRVLKYFYFRYPFLIKKIKNKNYDIEIAFLEGYSTVLVANRKNNFKKIAWVHTDLEKHRILKKNLERKSYRKMNKIICVSESSKKAILKLYPENKDKVEVIYNPIDKKNIINKSNKIMDYESIYCNDKYKILSIGRLNKQKGYDILIKSFSKLIKAGLECELIILGEGPERKNLEELLIEKKITDKIHLLGFKENPYPYLKNSDIFVSSSRYEGFSLVVAEAMCLGKAIISTNCLGPSEILKKGKYGVLVDVEDENDLFEKIKRMLLDKELKKKYMKLSKKGSKIFDMDKVIKKIEDLLDEK